MDAGVASGQVRSSAAVTKRLLFALKASGERSTLPSLVNLVQSGKVTPDAEEAIWTSIGTLGGPEELKLVFEHALASGHTRQGACGVAASA